MKLVFKTPAKINLGLFILGKRPDGYHDLETLFQMVSLYDTLELESIDDRIELLCDHPEVPADDSNLMVRAARLLQDAFPEKAGLGCRMVLNKRIPIGAGLGGGSGNAAGVLRGGGNQKLCNINWSASRIFSRSVSRSGISPDGSSSFFSVNARLDFQALRASVTFFMEKYTSPR